MWSERYDRELRDIFAVQDEIAAAIAGALRVRLSGEAPRTRYRRSSPAYEAYLRARHHQAQGDAGVAGTGEALLRVAPSRSIRRSAWPMSASGSTGSGRRYFGRCAGARGHPRGPRGGPARAGRSTPRLPEAHALLGYVAAFYDLDWDAAERHFGCSDGATGRLPADPADLRRRSCSCKGECRAGHSSSPSARSRKIRWRCGRG